MKLVHTAVRMESILPIIREGIRRGGDLQKSQREYVQSNQDCIYLSAVKGVSFPEIKATPFSYASMESYHFFLKDSWVRDHAEQFKERAIYLQSLDEFYEFVKSLGIGKSPHGMGEDDVWSNQIIPTAQIPIEGIESLLIKGDPTNERCDGWDLHGEDLSNIDPKIITSRNGCQFVGLRDIVPEGMALYVGDKSQNVKIK